MVAAIFLLALLLIAAGLAGLVLAFSLIPTDLGFAYFQASAVATSAGLVILALALAVRIIDRSLRRIAPPPPLRAEASAPGYESVEGAQQAAEKSRAKAGVQTAAGLAAAGAVAAGAAGLAGLSVEQPQVPENDRDVALPDIGDGAGTGKDSAHTSVEPDLFSAALRVENDRQTGDGEPSFDGAEISAAVLPRGELTAHSDDDSAREDAEAEDQSGIEHFSAGSGEGDLPVALPKDTAGPAETSGLVPEQAGEGVAPPPVPGLIHDADLEAVGDDKAPVLAPLDTLEVVGAYDSGGTRFTMYSDGSVTAEGLEGVRRFPSLDALRRSLEGGQ